uniref:Thioredoxin domain-containing protein n=1 Tax=Alexandrium catenella TaxID=2925 RepID=A0A7S1PQW7_ALECA|mmetsp:Transcript_107584/g.286308  ORF Transcript_107584/g.286308 Transcript_107584/m.286308 type:complete len:470 (+) Transcript_107584:52-1461(+)
MLTWPLAGALVLLFCTLYSASAGKEGSGAAADGGQARGDVHDEGELVEELTAETFVEKVSKVANGAERPAYVPVVMFHMPWCEHCKKTIPELQDTAAKVEEAVARGQLRHFPAVPKFFMLSCAEQGVDEICQNYTGKSYPSIIAFRDKRALKYNRPRVASVITWWAFRVTRPAISLLEAREPLEAAKENEVTFLLHLRSKSSPDTRLLQCWEQLALDYIEEYTLLFTFSGTPLGKTLGPAPTVRVYGPESMGLKPLPVKDPLDEDTLRAWVKRNQFPPVVEVGPWTLSGLKKSELRVVTLVYADDAEGRRAAKGFEAKASELRRSSGHLFGSINSTDEDSEYFLSYKFPLLASGAPPLPRMFVFSGVGEEVHFWEDPQFVSVEGLTSKAIEGLLNSREAFHDESYASWMKGKRKLLGRLARRSWTSLLTVVAVPLVALAALCACCRTLWQALCEEEPASEGAGKRAHAD